MPDGTKTSRWLPPSQTRALITTTPPASPDREPVPVPPRASATCRTGSGISSPGPPSAPRSGCQSEQCGTEAKAFRVTLAAPSAAPPSAWTPEATAEVGEMYWMKARLPLPLPGHRALPAAGSPGGSRQGSHAPHRMTQTTAPERCRRSWRIAPICKRTIREGRARERQRNERASEAHCQLPRDRLTPAPIGWAASR